VYKQLLDRIQAVLDEDDVLRTDMAPRIDAALATHLIATHLIATHLIATHLIATHLIATHRIATHLIATHLMSPRFRPLQAVCFMQGS